MPNWRPKCFRGSIYKDVSHAGSKALSPDLVASSPKICAERRGTVSVSLHKREGYGLGLTIAGGVDKGLHPQVSNLRPGSIAYRCDALIVGDYILSVNGIHTTNLRHDEIITLLKNTGTDVILDIQYEIPDPTTPESAGGQSQCHVVVLEKELNGLGLTLRGGMLTESMRSYPLTVVSVRPGGPADREGSVRVGDQVLSINGYNVSHLTLTETLNLISKCDKSATLVVSYHIAVMDSVENALGPQVIEVDRTPGTNLGITLSLGTYKNKQTFTIDDVQPMSIADRSGALHVGDHILSISGARAESMTIAEAQQLLKSGPEPSVQLELVPVTHLEQCAYREAVAQNSVAPPFSSHTLPVSPSPLNHYPSVPRRGRQHHSSTFSVGAGQYGTWNVCSRNAWNDWSDRRATSCMSIASSSTSVLSSTNLVCRTETALVTLYADPHGVGITLSSSPLSHYPVIVHVQPGSAADRCGLIREGDRALAVNGVDACGQSVERVNQLIEDSHPKCAVLLEFEVTESVTLSSGKFLVKLLKLGGETGISICASKGDKLSASNQTLEMDDGLYVSDVEKASAAHRCGSIQSGDKLLAINDIKMDMCTVEDADHLLGLPDPVVELQLYRQDRGEGNDDCIIYTVELQRYGGPLGITISGTEDPLDPIIVSELTPNGLAERTGAIHVGDKLLAISGESTKSKPLSRAISMLQSAGEVVTLKIARPGHIHEPNPLQIQQLAYGYSSLSAMDTPSTDRTGESYGGDALRSADNCHNNDDSVVIVAVPQSPEGKRKARSRSLGKMNGPSRGQVWDSDSELSNKENQDEDDSSSFEDDEDCDEDGNAQMQEWVKTLEGFDFDSGSEMLKQIGMSLRQRSTMNLDHPENTSSQKNIKSSRPSNGGMSGSLSCKTLSPLPASKISSHSLHSRDSRSQERTKFLSSLISAPAKDNRSESVVKPSEAVLKKTTSLPASAKTANGHGAPVKKSKGHGKKEPQIRTVFSPNPIQLQRVVMHRAKANEGFGFSLSDGLYDSGVYISAVKKGWPAHKAGLRIYDRVLQVNKEKTKDSGCASVVPLVCQAGERLTVVVCRNPLLRLAHSMKDDRLPY